MEKEVTVQIPASSSNCGPGFDTLSIALQIYHFVRIRLTDDGMVQGEVSDDYSPRWLAMALAARELFHEKTGIPLCGFTFSVWGEVPRARGLGHSAVIRAGILNGLNILHGNPLDEKELIRMTASLDSACDDAAAVHRGGFNVVRSDPQTGAYIGGLRFDVPESLSMIVVAPDIRVHTADARDALPQNVDFYDAVRSMNSAAYLVSIFATGEYERLRGSVSDFLHQQYRQRLCPFVPEAIDAGISVGAYTGWLSGSGSSVLCIADSSIGKEVGKAIRSVFENNGIGSRVFHTKTENKGLRQA